MCKVKTGGAAFPRSGFIPPANPDEGFSGSDYYASRTIPEPGMSLLDHFAGMALPELVAMAHGDPANPKVIRFTAKLAYDYAAAMIAERTLLTELAPLCQPGPDDQEDEVPPIPAHEVPPIPPVPPYGSGPADGSEDRKI